MTDREWNDKLLEAIERLKDGNEPVSIMDPKIDGLDGESMEAIIAVEPAYWMRNEFGKVSGAASAAIIEVSTGIAAQAIIGDNVTLDMNVSYLRELDAEHTIRTKVITVKPGRQILRLRGETYDGVTGKLAVMAELSIMKA